MRLSEFKIEKVSFYPILFLEDAIPRPIRRLILQTSYYLLLVSIGGLFVSKFYNHAIPWLINLLGLAFIFLNLAILILMLEAFFRSYYHTKAVVNELHAGRIIYEVKKGDLVKSFFSLPVGEKFANRLELSKNDIKNFLSERNEPAVDYELPVTEGDGFFTTKSLVLSLFKEDKEFAKFLFNHGVGEKDLVAILDWAALQENYDVKKESWWTRENLSKIRAVGKEYAFGRTPFLDKFSHDVSMDTNLFDEKSERAYRRDLVSQIEIAFSKSKEANVMVIGNPGVGVMGVVLDFVRKIVSGRVVAPVAYSRVVELNWNLLISESKTKTVFETNVIKCLNETLEAGNIILIIQNFPALLLSSESLGSYLTSLITPFLEKSVQIIATADPISFHKHIEQNLTLVQHFEKILVEEPNEAETLEVIENFIGFVERKNKLFFSYFAMAEVIHAANYYITLGVMPAKAIGLILEISSSAVYTGNKLIDKSMVSDFIRVKTKIPTGEIGSLERDKLLNLEESLHKRVVGQNEAIEAVSQALRRSRAGVRDPKKPIGSFLCLGPTGVGKTETAKALAQIFYGDEKYMMRLDMSEYQTSDSMDRLIGSFEGNKPGILSSMIRENPYGVLLLDEFEKADKDVLNLFLQILDEGFFSDMTGKRVPTQNIIFVATSNAASQMIFDITERGEDVSKLRSEIVAKIVSEGIFKPELVNRFDDTIIFHPLNKDELEKISVLMLKKLANRLREKGIELVIDKPLADKIVAAGYNRTFGARPMNRAIQEYVEEPIARKIISGELIAGGKIDFSTLVR